MIENTNQNLNTNRDFILYKIYGLNVYSQLFLHENLKVNNFDSNKNIKYDVKISIGIIENCTLDLIHSSGIFKFYENKIIFEISNLGKYEISNGNNIKIQPFDNINFEEIRKFTIGSALGMLMYQRNIIAIHGGSVSLNNNGIIICGSIGSGKTTIVSNLIKNGYEFLTDDVSSITLDNDNNYLVNPCFPHQKLCKDTAINLGYSTNDLIKIDKIKDKYYSPVVKRFSITPKPLKAIFYINTDSYEEIKNIEITGVEKLKLILSNIFRQEVMPPKHNIQYMKNCLSLSSKIKIYKITRPINKDSAKKICDIIENIINNKI